MIFLSKNGSDEYINAFAKGAGAKVINDKEFVFENSNDPIVLRSIVKHKIMKKCIEHNRDFYYMDSGYIGNYPSQINPNGWKWFHRIVKNNLQHYEIINRSSNRWDKLKHKIHPFKKTGRNILVVMPSEKPALYYNIDMDEWRTNTINQIKKYTDRPIVVREKANRQTRIVKTIYQDLDDAHAVVTLQSIAATEAVLYGVPAFGLAPNAASPVSSSDLSKIENPYYPDNDLVSKWAHHLAYGQFHIDELKDGTAYKILMEEQ